MVVADTLPDFTLNIHLSEVLGRATVDTILQTTQLDAANPSIAFCGPDQMHKTLLKNFAARGLSVRKIRYEEFKIRSGIGLKALATNLVERAKNRDTDWLKVPGKSWLTGCD